MKFFLPQYPNRQVVVTDAAKYDKIIIIGKKNKDVCDILIIKGQ